MDKELTIEEPVFDLIDYCDLCGKPSPITNNNDGSDYLEYNGIQLLCPKCRN